jgi:tRNA A-37 threonylcarbamoyl transferase component Bud32
VFSGRVDTRVLATGPTNGPLPPRPVNGCQSGNKNHMVPMPSSKLQTPVGTAGGTQELPGRQLRIPLDDATGLLMRNLARPVKIGHDSLIVEARLPAEGQEIRVALKQYRPRNWWKALCNFFRPGRATRAWRLARELRARDIDTPRPIAVSGGHGWRARTTSYLATEWVEGAENLHLYGWRLATRPLDERLHSAARCAECLGRLIGRMHAAGISHRDLKGANLLVVEGEQGVATWLVDLDGVRLRRRVNTKQRAGNLARLAAGLSAHPWISRTICCRFLRAYSAQFVPGHVAWKPLWRAVAAGSRRVIKKKHRRRQEAL